MDPGTKQLLIVADDYAGSAALLSEFLALASDFETLAVTDGDTAVQETLARTPHAVLLDIDMPRMSGIEAARLIRLEMHDARPLLIAFTGGTRVDEARRAGVFDHVLQKPADLGQLLDLFHAGRPAIVE